MPNNMVNLTNSEKLSIKSSIGGGVEILAPHHPQQKNPKDDPLGILHLLGATPY